jgi:hypothetical protein
VGEQIDVVGSATADDQFRDASPAAVQLRLARMAEEKANADLRDRVEALQLGDGRTLGEAARSDPRVAAALDRSLRRAHVFGVDYDSDRAARVRVGLDLRCVWQELNRR